MSSCPECGNPIKEGIRGYGLGISWLIVGQHASGRRGGDGEVGVREAGAKAR